MSDILLAFGASGSDMRMAEGDLLCDDSLLTAVIISLFTDRLAAPDDRLPVRLMTGAAGGLTRRCKAARTTSVRVCGCWAGNPPLPMCPNVPGLMPPKRCNGLWMKDEPPVCR